MAPCRWLSGIPLVLSLLMLGGRVSCDIQCPNPPSIGNASFVFEQGDASEPLVDSVIRYSCVAGYTLYNPDESVLRCSFDKNTGNAFWEGKLPSCLDIRCSDPPFVANASFDFKLGNASRHLVGSLVRYSCVAGHKLSHPNASSLRCSLEMENRKAVWEGEIPSCIEKIDCKDPGTSPHGERSGDCCSAGATLRFSCNDNYELVGESEITCLRTGNWSSRRPLCRPLYSDYCEFPDPKPNAKLRGTKDGDYFVPGETAEVWCRPGYKCEGNDNVECGEGGNWTKEFCDCEEVFCKQPPPIENGRITKGNGTNLTSFPYHSDIHYVCDRGYRIERGDSWRMCIDKGVWSGRNPSCEVIRCPDPGTPEYGTRSSSNFSVGSRITFSCNTGYELLGSGELLCQANGQWAGELTRCDHPDNFCPDPGTPIRGSKNTSKYNKGTKVSFQCDSWSIQRGSKVRECMPNRTWSGTPTKCIGLYDFDNAGKVSLDLINKMEEIKEHDRLEVEKFETVSRMIVDAGFRGRTILYFAFDVSSSIPKDNFYKSVNIAKAIVKRVGVSEPGTRIGAITFASKVTTQFLPMHCKSVEEVLAALDTIEHTGGGTAASSALHYIRKDVMPVVRGHLNDTEIKSVIIILTDGRANMGGDPKKEAKLLKKQDVDIYCIGITGNLAREVLYEIASSDPKTGKSYAFLLQDYETMSWLVQEITSGEANYSQCGLGKEDVAIKSSRIVGGTEVTKPWLWMAALYMTEKKGKTDKKLQCGGSVIHPYFILTAAHCMFFNTTDKREPNDITVKLGLVNVTDTENVLELEVRQIYIHDDYSRKTLDYDAALLELKTPIKYSSRQLPICLPPKAMPEGSLFYKPGSKVWIAGWGHKSMYRKGSRTIKTSNVLKEILLDIQTRDTCKESLADDNKVFTDRMFCAGTGGARNDTCYGDSGGPVMQQDFNEEGYVTWTQVGIVSWGIGCGLKREFGMYVHLHQMMPWVNETIQRAERNMAAKEESEPSEEDSAEVL